MNHPNPSTHLPRKTRVLWIVSFLAVAAVFTGVIASRLERRASAVEFSRGATGRKPAVNAVPAAAAPATVDLILPGSTEAVVVSDIYARATGYVKARYVDIGDRVRAGQVLAVIESPELDQELGRASATMEESRAAWQQAQANITLAEENVLEAQARLEQSQANDALAAATAQRWSRLVSKGVLPRQEGDERQFASTARKAEVAAAQAAIRTAQAGVNASRSGAAAAAANLRANQANVARLSRMAAFERVVAPFDGIVTERLVEQGNLIAAGSVDGRKLFAIAQPAVLRVQVNVSQTFAPDMKEGQAAELSVRERPGRVFTGTVARTANALNPASRTLLVEVQVENQDGALLPGMFAEVKFALPRSQPATLIPAEALVADAQGTRAAVVDAQQTVRFRPITVGRDLGTHVEVVAGLLPGEAVILNPGELLVQGQAVEVIPAQRGAKEAQ